MIHNHVMLNMAVHFNTKFLTQCLHFHTQCLHNACMLPLVSIRLHSLLKACAHFIVRNIKIAKKTDI